jgi:hypothetical protein
VDSDRFDLLTKRLATDGSRRSILHAFGKRLDRRSLVRGLIGGGAALATSGPVHSFAAPAGKVTICHWTPGQGGYQQISVSQNAVKAHQNHQHGMDIINPDFNSNETCGNCNTVCNAFPNSVCVEGACTCTENVCGADQCGAIDSGCGNEIDCGPCDCVPNVCAEGQCGVIDSGCGYDTPCPTTCDAFPNSYCSDEGVCACDANTCGDQCGSVDSGCGYALQCDPCECSGTPEAVYADVAGLPIPDGLKVTCYDGPNSPSGSIDTGNYCPVVKECGFTFVPLSFIDNRESIAITAYDSDGNYVAYTEAVGTRYAYAASVNYGDQSVTFFGQGGTGSSASFATLDDLVGA